MPDFYPDIFEYLESVQTSKSVSAKDMDEVILKVRAHTGLDKDICTDIVKYFFQEIRGSMMRGEQTALRGLGRFYIASPRTGSRKKIFAKFEPYKTLLRRINDRD